MQEALTKYEEIGSFLQESVSLETINLLKSRLDEQYFYVPVIGQFSSGKSSLLNNLLGRRFLPTMLSETTAYTTFIYYGETEYAEIVTKDQTVHTFALEKLMDLSQRNLQTPTSVSDILGIPSVQNTDILCINVFIHHSLFETGLVFVDTPGLNTIISTHENRTFDLLPKAHAILYVMGKALTAADVKLISLIDQMGIDLIFIRTKIDQLRRDENDTPTKVMDQDRDQLEKAIGRSVTYFGVTNEEDLLPFARWKELIDKLQQYLQAQLINMIDERRQASIQRRLQKIREVFLTNLYQRQEQLALSNSVTDEDIQRKIASLQSDIEYVQTKVKMQEKNFRSSFDAIQHTILAQYDEDYRGMNQQYEKALQQLTTVEALQEQAETLAERYISKASDRLNDKTNTTLQGFLAEATVETNATLQGNLGGFTLGNIENISLQVSAPTITEVFEQGEFIQSKLESSSEVDQKFEEIQRKRQAMEQQSTSIQQQFEAAQTQLNELGEYVPQYVERANHENESNLRILGNVLDWAMVFIPGKAFSTGATKIATVLNTAAQGKKYADTVTKVTTGIKKTGDILAKTDKYKDIVKVAQSAQDRNQKDYPHKAEKFNILNLVSVEYWFGQIGKTIDGPPRVVEDEAYRQAYIEQRDAIQAQLQHTKQLEMMRMQQLDLLNTREERLREEKRLEEKYQKQLEQQLFEAKQKHEQKLKEQQVVAYRKQLLETFANQTHTLFANYRSNLADYLQRFILHVPAVLTLELQKQLHIQKSQLEELIATRQETEKTQLQYEMQLSGYLHYLNS